MFLTTLLHNPLLIISFLPLIGIIFIFVIPRKYTYWSKFIVLFVLCGTFLVSLSLWVLFSSNTSFFQYSFTWLWLPFFNLNYTIGVDGISLFFILLTTFLILLCLIVSWSTLTYLIKEYLLCFLILEFCLIQVFCVLDLFLFYIFFESVLIPMFLIIGIWGSRIRKIRAAYQFFLFTLIGSFFMFVGIIYIYILVGTTDCQVLLFYNFSENIQLVLWLSFFLSFSVKIPMMPFHIWLPEAHAEAPTTGSIILAGVLLKLGGYGFIRFSLPLFPLATVYFSPLIFMLSISAIIYGSLTTLRQIDLKKIIAYSSISHMGFVTLGIFSLTLQGIEGGIFLMLSHGLVSSALFLCIGILYERYKTRIIKYYNGLTQTMPLFSCFFLFFSFANIGFPGTSSFIGEFLILVGLFHFSLSTVFSAAIGVILSAAYSIWLFNRINFGSLNLLYFLTFQDISRREFYLLLILLIVIIWIGLNPNSFLIPIHFSVVNLLEHFN